MAKNRAYTRDFDVILCNIPFFFAPEIMSKPYVHKNDELATDLAGQIIERLSATSKKQYPPATALVVNCVADCLIFESEWNDAIERVNKAQLHLGVWEVFLPNRSRLIRRRSMETESIVRAA